MTKTVRSVSFVSSMKIDEAARRSRLEFLEITGGDGGLLESLGRAVLPHIDRIIDRWYDFLLERPETRDLLRRGRVLEHLKGAQAQYFQQLLKGPYDEAYFEERLRIGFIHERVGLAPPWYTGAYRKFQDVTRTFLLEAGHPAEQVVSWMRSLEKLVFLDMELALDAYFDTFSRELVDANTALRGMTTELEGRNAELVRQYEKAQEAARIKEEFLSRVSHELRTPLNSVMGYSDLLLDGIEGPLNEGQAGAVGRIREQGGRLLSMIEWIIETAKMAATVRSEPVPFDPLPALRRVADLGKAAAAAKGLAFEVDLEPGVPTVVGDESGLELCLGHLVENAVKFAAAGRVRLEVRQHGDRARFIVSDTGPGIGAQQRERIFEPFYQADFGDTRTATGLGIGLTLARRAMEQMGGTLRLESSGPAGSTFVAELPVAERP